MSCSGGVMDVRSIWCLERSQHNSQFVVTPFQTLMIQSIQQRATCTHRVEVVLFVRAMYTLHKSAWSYRNSSASALRLLLCAHECHFLPLTGLFFLRFENVCNVKICFEFFLYLCDRELFGTECVKLCKRNPMSNVKSEYKSGVAFQ